MSMILYSSRILRNLNLSLFPICECKSKKFFPNYQNFFKVFFHNPKVILARSKLISCAAQSLDLGLQK